MANTFCQLDRGHVVAVVDDVLLLLLLHCVCMYICRGVDSFLDGDLGQARLDQGWEVVAFNTSPAMGSVGNCKIHFGEHKGRG